MHTPSSATLCAMHCLMFNTHNHVARGTCNVARRELANLKATTLTKKDNKLFYISFCERVMCFSIF